MPGTSIPYSRLRQQWIVFVCMQEGRRGREGGGRGDKKARKNWVLSRVRGVWVVGGCQWRAKSELSDLFNGNFYVGNFKNVLHVL